MAKREYCRVINLSSMGSIIRVVDRINEYADEGYRIIAINDDIIYMVIPDNDIQTTGPEREYSLIDSLPSLSTRETTGDAS